MVDIKKILDSKYQKSHRFSNFGSVVNEIEVNGFRGVKSKISLDFPVTALTGFNGSGKSTIGQLILCGYRRLTSMPTAKRFYVKDFFPVSVVDPTPFTNTATVLFRFQTDKSDVDQELTISRTQKEWSGYKRQPERNTEYVGFTVYIPKVERKDLSIYNGSSLTLVERSDVENAQKYVSEILGTPYDDIYFQGVSAKNKEGNLGIATRYGASYSENNMGFGEGRVVYTVKLLETCPEQSLIVLEEPETSLHEYAQYQLAKYLMDVSNRRRHQIIFTTHSNTMMDALPSKGRKLLVRESSGVSVYDNISSARIRTALSAGMKGHVVLCVEDAFAKTLLSEIIRRYDQNLLDTIEIFEFGDEKSVVSAMKVLEKSGSKAFAVKDGDMAADKINRIFKLPGSLAPEKEVFGAESTRKSLKDLYNFNFEEYLKIYPQTDHHDYSKIVADKKGALRQVVESDCIRAFLDDVGKQWSQQLCDDLKKQIHSG